MIKHHFGDIKKPYWLSETNEISPDGLPVYTQEELDLIERHKDTLSASHRIKIYRAKMNTVKNIAQMDFNDLLSGPEKRGLDICADILESLQQNKARQRLPEELRF